MKLIKFLFIMIALIVGLTTACCHVTFDKMGYDIFLTARWNQDLKVGINYKGKLEYKVLASDDLLDEAEVQIKRKLAGY